MQFRQLVIDYRIGRAPCAADMDRAIGHDLDRVEIALHGQIDRNPAPAFQPRENAAVPAGMDHIRTRPVDASEHCVAVALYPLPRATFAGIGRAAIAVDILMAGIEMPQSPQDAVLKGRYRITPRRKVVHMPAQLQHDMMVW